MKTKTLLFQLLLGGLLASPSLAQTTTKYYWSSGHKIPVMYETEARKGYVTGSDFPIIPTGDIILKVKPTTNLDELLASIEGGATIKHKQDRGKYVIHLQNPALVFDVANRIYESGQVTWCHPDFIITVVKSQINDPLYPSQYYLNNPTNDIDINAPEAWAITKGVHKIRVAVLDEGLDHHEDLSNLTAGFSADDPNGAGMVPASSNASHGMACAGIIGADHNSVGMAGVAPCSDLVPVRILDIYFDIAQTAAAIDWSWREGHADVLSNSWNYSCDQPGTISGFDVITEAYQDARTLGRNGLGCPVVFSAGNRLPYQTDVPLCVQYPANIKDIIAVGAIDNMGNVHAYSGRGTELDLVAPSGLIYQGNVVTLDLMGSRGSNSGNYRTDFTGTSAACPQVAGAAALMLSANPTLTETQVRTMLQNTAKDMGPSGFDVDYGFGRLNVEAALTAALPVIQGPTALNNYGTNAYSLPRMFFSADNITWSATPAAYFGPSTQPQSNTYNVTRNLSVAVPRNGVQAVITAVVNGSCGSVTVTKNITIYPEMIDQPDFQPAAYPNPVDSKLTVTLPAAQSRTQDVTLYDAYGQTKKVFSHVSGSLTFDATSLAEGVYFLRISGEDKTTTQQIIVKH